MLTVINPVRRTLTTWTVAGHRIVAATRRPSQTRLRKVKRTHPRLPTAALAEVLRVLEIRAWVVGVLLGPTPQEVGKFRIQPVRQHHHEPDVLVTAGFARHGDASALKPQRSPAVGAGRHGD